MGKPAMGVAISVTPATTENNGSARWGLISFPPMRDNRDTLSLSSAGLQWLDLQKAFGPLRLQGPAVGRHLQIHAGDGRAHDDSVGSAIEGLTGLLS